MPLSIASELGNLRSFHLAEETWNPSLGIFSNVQQTLLIPARPGGSPGVWQRMGLPSPSWGLSRKAEGLKWKGVKGDLCISSDFQIGMNTLANLTTRRSQNCARDQKRLWYPEAPLQLNSGELGQRVLCTSTGSAPSLVLCKRGDFPDSLGASVGGDPASHRSLGWRSR